MIVCHCNFITHDEIRAAIRELRDADPYRVIIPGLVYHRLGKRGRCCGCFPHVIEMIIAENEGELVDSDVMPMQETG